MSGGNASRICVDMQDLQGQVTAILCNAGLSHDRAALCSKVICQNSADGVHSHGLGRLGRLVRQIKAGQIDVNAEATLIESRGSIERWNGNRGIGILNALSATDRALKIAEEHGLGLVGLANTSHWLRAGYYGWRAADCGYAFICWTNTSGNMKPWGGTDHLLGNNPIVFALPRQNGRHFVLDMAMSQFSYGALGEYVRRGEKLPVPGGWDHEGELSYDPKIILENANPLPIGFWKGSALSLMLDMFAAMVSGGASVAEVNEEETNISQVYLAIRLDSAMAGRMEEAASVIEEQFDGGSHNRRSMLKSQSGARYPGRAVYEKRLVSREYGIAVPVSLYEEILALG